MSSVRTVGQRFHLVRVALERLEQLAVGDRPQLDRQLRISAGGQHLSRRREGPRRDIVEMGVEGANLPPRGHVYETNPPIAVADGHALSVGREQHVDMVFERGRLVHSCDLLARLDVAPDDAVGCERGSGNRCLVPFPASHELAVGRQREASSLLPWDELLSVAPPSVPDSQPRRRAALRHGDQCRAVGSEHQVVRTTRTGRHGRPDLAGGKVPKANHSVASRHRQRLAVGRTGQHPGDALGSLELHREGYWRRSRQGSVAAVGCLLLGNLLTRFLAFCAKTSVS